MIIKAVTRLTGLVVVTLLLLLGVLSTAASATYGTWSRSQCSTSSAHLAYSYSADRSNAASLNGAEIERGGHVAVFVGPLSTRAKTATFFLNGHQVKIEYKAPYDMLGTKRNGKAAPVDSNHFRSGGSTITVVFDCGNRTTQTIEATFTANAPAPAEKRAPTIAEIATSDERFTTLVTALSTATESGPVDFLGTVLNDALADPSGLLTMVLAYHVLGTNETGADLVAAQHSKARTSPSASATATSSSTTPKS